MVGLARRLNPNLKILARCEYVSTGMKLSRRGADEVVVAEQVIAAEFGRLVGIVADAEREPPAAVPPPPPSPAPSPPREPAQAP
jgi:voltage-gated potassium channel Kch